MGVGKMNARLTFAFTAAEFRILLRKMRRKKIWCCACLTRSYAHNRIFTPFTIV
jgi:hypothetical protein